MLHIGTCFAERSHSSFVFQAAYLLLVRVNAKLLFIDPLNHSLDGHSYYKEDHIEELLLLLDPLDRLVDDHGNDEDEHPKKEAEKG